MGRKLHEHRIRSDRYDKVGSFVLKPVLFFIILLVPGHVLAGGSDARVIGDIGDGEGHLVGYYVPGSRDPFQRDGDALLNGARVW